jgi:hypothetical protein
MKQVFFGTMEARILTSVLLIAASLLVMGATRVTQEMRKRPARCYEITCAWQDWSHTVLTAVPGGEKDEWRRLAEQSPLMVLQACYRPLPAASVQE